MTANEIQNLVDDPEAEEEENPQDREIDDLVDQPENEIDLDDELLGD